MTFERLGSYTDAAARKPVANLTRYTYSDGNNSYIYDGAYLRFTGELRIEHHHAGKIVNSYTDTAIWELMYLGKTRHSR